MTVFRFSAALMIAGVVVGSVGCSGPFNSTPVASSSSLVLSGTVKDKSGGALSGYTVTYDKNTVVDPKATLTSVTDISGGFSITVPYTDIKGADSLSVYDNLGGIAAVQPVTLHTGVKTVTANVVVSDPPLPPAVAR